MLEQTIDYIRKIDVEIVSAKVKSYCETIGEKVPDNARLKLEIAKRLANPSADSEKFQSLSAKELSEIKKTIQRAEELAEYGDRLVAFRDLIIECDDAVPDAKLCLIAKDLTMRFSPELLLGESHSPYSLDARCENFANDYQTAYIAFHNSWHNERRRNEPRIRKLADMSRAADTLKAILDGSSEGEFDWIAKTEKILLLPLCEEISSPKIGFAPYCPNCGLRYGRAYDWSELDLLEREIERSLENCQTQIAKKLATDLVRRSSEDPLSGLVEAINVSDLSKLPSILTDDVIDALRKVLK